MGDDAIEPERIEGVVSQGQTVGVEPQRSAVLHAEDHRVGLGVGSDEPRHVDIAPFAAPEVEGVHAIGCRYAQAVPDARECDRAYRRSRTGYAGRSQRRAIDSSAAAVNSIITGHIGSRNRRYHQASNGW